MMYAVFRNVRFLPGTINAGFPSPACDYVEWEQLFHASERGFMIGGCIYDADILVVDRAITWVEVHWDEGSSRARRRSFAGAQDDKHTALSMTNIRRSA